MILITEDVWGAQFEGLRALDEVCYEPDLWNQREAMKEKLRNATVLVVRNRTKVDAELIAASPKLKLICRAGVGLDNIDLSAADARGIAVSAALGVNAISVAEHTLGLALALARNIITHDLQTESGKWIRTPGMELRGKTWGMLGFGATAQCTATLLQGFGVNKIAYDPYAKFSDSQLQSFGVELVSLDSVIEKSDIISVHLPHTPATKNLLNAAEFSRMKKGVLIVSVGRGEVIDETDLIAALKSGHLGGAALDVRASEPPTIGELELFENVILTPHIAGITHESQSAILELLAADIMSSYTGAELRGAVGKIRSIS